MKVLFQSVYVTTPHFETELELMKEHLLKKDEVYVLQCKEDLKSCFMNFKNSKWRCYICQKKFERGINMLENQVNLLQYPFENKGYYDNIPAIFENIEQLKAFKIDNAELGICTASTLISALNREHLLDTHEYKDTVYREINNAYYVYLSFKETLTQIKPDLVYLFNGRFSTILPALNACEELHIAYKTHERGGKIGYYDLFDNSVPHDLGSVQNAIINLAEATSEDQCQIEGQRFFEDRRNRIVHSWMSYTNKQQYYTLPNNFDCSKRNFTFFNTTIEEISAVRSWDNPIRIYTDEIDAICQIAESFLNMPQYHFYLRVHPNLTGFDNSQTQRIKSIENKYPNLTVIPPSSKIDSYALMEHSEAVITFSSTMGVEACYWGKPSILLGKAFYQGLDCCYIPNSHEEVVSLIANEKLLPKSKNEALLYGNWELSRGYKYKYFHQTGLFSGTFNGRKINLSRIHKLFLLIKFMLMHNKNKLGLFL